MKPQRIVNVHQAKTHLSRLIDDAHALLEPICQPNWPRGRAAASCLGSPAMSDAAGYLLNSHVLLW